MPTASFNDFRFDMWNLVYRMKIDCDYGSTQCFNLCFSIKLHLAILSFSKAVVAKEMIYYNSILITWILLLTLLYDYYPWLTGIFYFNIVLYNK